MDDEKAEGCCCVVSGVRPSLNAVFSSVQYMHPTSDTASAPRQEVTVAALHPLGDSAAVRTTRQHLLRQLAEVNSDSLPCCHV